MNARHRLFAQAFAVHGVGARAAEEAGYKVASARKTASKLLKRDDVQELIEELRSEARKAGRAASAVTLASLTAELEEARLGAMEDRDWPAAIRAVQAKALLHGLAGGDPAALDGAQPITRIERVIVHQCPTCGERADDDAGPTRH